MKFDYSKLRGRIIEKFGSITAFAKAYGLSLITMSKKLNGKVAFSPEDIVRMSAPEFLDIQPCEYHEYFFVHMVHEMWIEIERMCCNGRYALHSAWSGWNTKNQCWLCI